MAQKKVYDYKKITMEDMKAYIEENAPQDKEWFKSVAIGTKKAYRRVLDQILKMTCFLDADINIFADNDPDSSLDFYKQIFKDYRSIFPNINIYYNEKGKDFGDLSKPILARRCEI